MRRSNPVLKDNIFENTYALTERPMTISGTLNKLLILTFVLLLSAGATYYQFSLGRLDYVSMLMTIGCIVGLILMFIICFKPVTAPYLAPIYAFAQGAALSGISCFMNAELPGIVIQAVSMTFIVLLIMTLLYRIGALRATETFRKVLLLATMAIFVFYMISIIMSFFGHLPAYFTSNSNLSIVVNVAIAIIAALNLIIDFDFIERGASAPLPSVYEWYGAFGLLVTIIWLYIEILRLLARFRSR